MSISLTCLLEKLGEFSGQPIVVASHPRSGTHLCIDTLRLNFTPCHSWKLPFESADRLYFTLEEWGMAGRVQEDLILRIMKRVRRPLIKTHALPGLESVPVWGLNQGDVETRVADWVWKNAKILYTYRDGREVMRSFHALLTTRFEGQPESFSNFLRERRGGESRVRLWARHVESWLAEPRAHCISMESLLNQPAQTIGTWAAALDLPPLDGTAALPPRCDREISSRFWRRASVRPASTAVSSRYSYSPAPHWTDVFAPADREFFHQEAGHMLFRLGYERSDNWIDGKHSSDDSAWRAPHVHSSSELNDARTLNG